MKRLTVFILLLVNSFCFKSFACYFYPYGEDIRFSIFSPDNFRYNGFRVYNYTTHLFYDENYVTNPNVVTENDLMWFSHCQKKVPVKVIKNAVFEIDISEVSPKSKNEFVQYLYNRRDFEAINYLIFAKELEKLGLDSEDLWENNKGLKDVLRNNKIKEAFSRIESVKNPILKKRYYYQVFKLLAFMEEDSRTISLYETYAKQFKTQDFLDDWILFYRMAAEQDRIKTNYLAAQVFARGTDNKFDIKWYFNRNIPIEKVLKFAQNDKERANIHVLYSFRRVDQNLVNIKKVHQYDPGNSGLSFLLFREINKIEDWILTPTYTMYLPTLREDYWENSNGKRILNRVEVDRLYAFQVLAFVNSVNLNKVDDKEFWLMAKAYLEFMVRNYDESLKTISSFENQIKDKKVKNQCDIIKALVLTANQTPGKACIPKAIEELLVAEAQKHNNHFLFGIAKELEILGDKADAAFLISKITVADQYDEYQSGLYWKSGSGKITLHDDFYYDWYGYTDAELSTADMLQLLTVVNSGKLSAFDLWKSKELRKEPNRINDLMGIKFMREDNLEMAYRYFSKVADNHYTNGPLFNENPFYRIKGYMSFDSTRTTKGMTKAKVVQQLMQLIKKANNPNNKNRNKDYLLVANCYYNMSYYGNSWMMKRISRTGNHDSNYDDEMEYYRCHKAKYYYQKAFETSKSDEFKAMSMYMMGKCKARENEFLLEEQHEKYYYLSSKDYDKASESAFKELKKRYPQEYDVLTSNCEIFSDYFKSKR